MGGKKVKGVDNFNVFSLRMLFPFLKTDYFCSIS